MRIQRTYSAYGALLDKTAIVKTASDKLRGFYRKGNATPCVIRTVYSGDVDMPKINKSNTWIHTPVYVDVKRDRKSRPFVSRKIK